MLSENTCTLTTPPQKGEIKMKNVGKYILWILGTAAWLFILLFFWSVDVPTGNNTHQIILIITGICLALYIFRKTGSKTKELEKENQELKAEIKELKEERQ